MGARALLALALAAPASAERHAVCPRIEVEGPRLTLADNERRVLCGDPSSEGWREVPRPQAEGFLRAFLQQRGRHAPRFREEGGALVVDPGPVTRVSRWTAAGLPPGIDLSKRRRVLGEPLTPKLLDQTGGALGAELQNRGYPCPVVAMSADAGTGALRADVKPGPFLRVEDVEEPALERLDVRVFKRYEAFLRGRPLDQRLLALTSDRLVTDALFLSSYYDLLCDGRRPRIAHRVVEAPPRVVRIGLGVDTEGLLLVRASWQHARIGERASTAQSSVYASVRQQTATAQLRGYPDPGSRVYLAPSAQGSHDDEPRYETLSLTGALLPGDSWDTQSLRLEAATGPSIEYENTLRGLGPRDAAFVAWNAHAELTTHAFESNKREPREGYHAVLDTASRAAGAYSAITAHRVRLGHEELWNLGGFEPPLAVLASRGWAGTIWTPDLARALEELGPQDRFFLGGDADFRGVGPRSLPGDEQGFLSAAYEGVELRAADWLPYRLQPLVFVDGAMGGRRPFRLQRDVFWAPGFGARVASPIGAFRGTVAHGFVWRRDPAGSPQPQHWQFFFSYGREF